MNRGSTKQAGFASGQSDRYNGRGRSAERTEMTMAENSIRVIDIDGHVREADDLWERYLEPPFRSRAPKIQRVPNGQLLFLLEGNRHHRKPDESPFQVKPDGS